MHKLIEYVCDELEELERKADKEDKLSMAEIQYADTLAHLKKNLLKAEEMEDGEYSQMADGRSFRRDGMSMARGRRGGVRRDAMGRYSRGYSYEDDMHDMADTIRGMMADLPEDVKHDAHNLVKKLEKM